MNLPRILERSLSIADPLQDEENFFNHILRWPRTQDDNGHMAFLPLCDITESNKGFKVKVELPGMEKDDIDVSLADGVLQIEAESSSEEEEKEGNRILRSERRYGKYMRRFDLGKDVNENEIRASFKDGVLKLDIPKHETTREEATKIAIEG